MICAVSRWWYAGLPANKIPDPLALIVGKPASIFRGNLVISWSGVHGSAPATFPCRVLERFDRSTSAKWPHWLRFSNTERKINGVGPEAAEAGCPSAVRGFHESRRRACHQQQPARKNRHRRITLKTSPVVSWPGTLIGVREFICRIESKFEGVPIHECNFQQKPYSDPFLRARSLDRDGLPRAFRAIRFWRARPR